MGLAWGGPGRVSVWPGVWWGGLRIVRCGVWCGVEWARAWSGLGEVIGVK